MCACDPWTASLFLFHYINNLQATLRTDSYCPLGETAAPFSACQGLASKIAYLSDWILMVKYLLPARRHDDRIYLL